MIFLGFMACALPAGYPTDREWRTFWRTMEISMAYVLPDWEPFTEEVENPCPPFSAGPWSQAAQFPPIQKLADGRIVVDWWVGSGRVVAKAWRRADHPNISLLPWNAPRSVKTMYRADTQLAYLRGDVSAAEKAMDAWEQYVVSSKRARPTE
jgi:hypothetical protein